jgi:hypothetical protein
MKAYQIRKQALKDLQASVKLCGGSNSYFYGMTTFNDKSAVDEETLKSLRRQFAVALGLDEQILSAARIPNTRRSLLCYGWMWSFFELIGDKAPNSTEIHLEPVTKLEIFREYQAAIASYFPDEKDELCLEYTSFLNQWETCFSHVKIREYKAVSGKCTTCATLSDLRRKYKSVHIRQTVTDLHALHRITYMAERMNYYRKQWLAITHPDMYMSVILDGMAQKHTALPYLANQKEFPATLKMHLQGVIEHGQKFVSCF